MSFSYIIASGDWTLIPYCFYFIFYILWTVVLQPFVYDQYFKTWSQVIVFCTTAMMTSLMFSLFREMKMNVREIHSRKPQIYRNRISEEFKESKRLILISSDVSARGMNYPDVTLVIQVNISITICCCYTNIKNSFQTSYRGFWGYSIFLTSFHLL